MSLDYTSDEMMFSVISHVAYVEYNVLLAVVLLGMLCWLISLLGGKQKRR